MSGRARAQHARRQRQADDPQGQQRKRDDQPRSTGQRGVTTHDADGQHHHERNGVVQHRPEHVTDHQHLGGHSNPLDEAGVGAKHPRRSQHRVVERQERHEPCDEEDPEPHGWTPSKINAKAFDLDLEDDREHHHEQCKLDQRRDRRPQPAEVGTGVARGERTPRELREQEAVARRGSGAAAATRAGAGSCRAGGPSLPAAAPRGPAARAAPASCTNHHDSHHQKSLTGLQRPHTINDVGAWCVHAAAGSYYTEGASGKP